MSKRTSLLASSASAALILATLGALQLTGCKKDDSSSADGISTTQPSIKPIVSKPVVQPAVGFQQRSGDEIVVCGQLFRIGTRVVTWMDPGGYDAYRTERRFAEWDKADFAATTQEIADNKKAKRAGPDITSPNRYGLRYGDSYAYNQTVATQPTTMMANPKNWDSPTTRPLTPEQFEMVRGGGWPLSLLQQKVDQFVVHYDVAGTSRYCFDVLHDDRDLSVHFMLDLDGTIYQTLDLKERAWQATKANGRSIGIEIANIGAYGNEKDPFESWYKKDANGQTYITIPARQGGAASQYTHPAMLRPARNEMVNGVISKLQKDGSFTPVRYRQYDLTPQQYAALPKLIAGLCEAFPLIKCDYPRESDGSPMWRTMTDKEYNVYSGVLGHYHVQTEKTDPGPAFQWDKVIGDAKRLIAQHHSMASK